MVYFPSMIFSGITQGTVFSATAAASGLVANVVRDFFMNIFLHPGEHSTAVMILLGAAGGTCVGIAFLIKLVFDKYCQHQV